MATPIVSARTISSTPSLRKWSARPETTPGSTRPSKGQPNATLIVTVVFAGRAVAILEARCFASSSEAFAFRWLKLSVAPSVTLTRSSPDAWKRSKPVSFSTSPAYSTPSRRSISSTTSSAPAICATASSRTKLTASIRRRPVAARRLTSSARVSGGRTSRSFWSPSRGPTSQIVIKHALGCNPHDHAALARPVALELRVPRVLLGELVDVAIRFLALLELDGAGHRHVLVWIIVRVDLDRDPRVALHVTATSPVRSRC